MRPAMPGLGRVWEGYHPQEHFHKYNDVPKSYFLGGFRR